MRYQIVVDDFEILNHGYELTFYYDPETKAIEIRHVTQHKFSPVPAWGKIVRTYVYEKFEYELRSLAEYKIDTEDEELMRQLTEYGNKQNENDVSADTVYPAKYRRG